MWPCTMPGLSRHLVQELNVGIVEPLVIEGPLKDAVHSECDIPIMSRNMKYTTASKRPL